MTVPNDDSVFVAVHKWVWVYLVCHIPSVIFQMYVVLLVYMMFIPVMGRSGTVNGDMYIGLLSTILILYLLNFAVSYNFLFFKLKTL